MSGDGGGEQDPPGQAGDCQQVHSTLSTPVLKIAQFNTKAQVSVLPLVLALPSILGAWSMALINKIPYHI